MSAANSHRRRRNRGTAPSTPLLRWNPAAAAPTSSRKLAADLWRLRFDEISVDRLPRPKPESFVRNLNRSEERSRGFGSRLQSELAQAKARVRELEAKRRFLDRLGEERLRREIEELVEERKCRRRMEILNAKLVDELAEVNLSAKRVFRDYEEERKCREFVEDVCDKLLQQIGDGKAKSEWLKREFMRVGSELEEERKMLQLAEVWREERVQMKLVDAKLALEDKFSEMNCLIMEFEAFLGSNTSATTLDVDGLRKAEKILKAAAESMSIQDIAEKFTYVPPESNDIVSILRELRGLQGNDGEIYGEETISEASTSIEDEKLNVSPASMTQTLKTSDRKSEMSRKEMATPVKHPCVVEYENPHITRGMKGCIEWPRVVPKSGLKAKISEAVIENQKSQIRHILKPKT